MNNWTIEDLQRNVGEKTFTAVDVKADVKAVNDKKTYTFIMSDEVMDSHGTIVKLDGAELERYNKNPLIIWQHQTGSWDEYNPDNIIGKGRAFYEDGLLKNEIEFEPKELNELADKVSRKIDFGSINAGSIGFIFKDGAFGNEERGEDPDIFYIKKWELVEYSIVSVPSNPNALVERAKSEQKDVTILTEESTKASTQGKSPHRERAFNKLRFLKLRK